MPAGTKTIQRRIKSVSNTKKITKAMEMVSAAKMRKATSSVLATRPYSDLAWQIIGRIKKSSRHPLFASRKTKSGKELLILISSDKGLCGGFNSQLFREIKSFSSQFLPPSVIGGRQGGGRSLDVIVLGKKGEKFVAREKFNVTAVFENLTNNPKFTDIKSIAKIAMQKFADKTYDKVFVAYTNYKSTLVQKPKIKQLLPVRADKELGATSEKPSAISRQLSARYIFEPQGMKLLEIIVPKIVETQIFQAVLESVASEYSARMVAMKNATDAASDMVDDLRFTFNKIRQASITREISEISAGKAALE
jgi:F-type H+-transporting ATPase subunit gamma